MTNTEDHAWSQKPMQLASEDTAGVWLIQKTMLESETKAQLASEDTARSASLTVL